MKKNNLNKDDKHWISTLYERYVELFGDPEEKDNERK